MVNLQHPTHREGSQLLLVDSSVLPEFFLRHGKRIHVQDSRPSRQGLGDSLLQFELIGTRQNVHQAIRFALKKPFLLLGVNPPFDLIQKLGGLLDFIDDKRPRIVVKKEFWIVQGQGQIIDIIESDLGKRGKEVRNHR